MEWNISEISSYISYVLSDRRILILAIVLAVSILFAVISLILYLRTKKRHLQKTYKNELDKESSEENIHSHKKSLLKIRRINNPKEALSELGKTVKKASKEILKTDTEMTFGELSEKLKEKNKTALANFCKEIEYLTYSEENPTKEKIKELSDKFEKALRYK